MDHGRQYYAQLALRHLLDSTTYAEPSNIPSSIIHHFFEDNQARSDQQVTHVLNQLASLMMLGLLSSPRILTGLSFYHSAASQFLTITEAHLGLGNQAIVNTHTLGLPFHIMMRTPCTPSPHRRIPQFRCTQAIQAHPPYSMPYPARLGRSFPSLSLRHCLPEWQSGALEL